MKTKRCAAWVLCLLLCLGLFPLSSFATGDRYLEINKDNFPDDVFRAWIIENLSVSGSAQTGYYMTRTQVASVKRIEVEGLGIQSLAGIGSFTELTWLDAGPTYDDDYENVIARNYLTELDLSGNTALGHADVSHNRLTALNVSRNTSLWELDCSHNLLTTLDVSRCTELWSLICSYNQLTALNLSKSMTMEELDCSYNQLTSLELKNTGIINLFCDHNQLTKLDVSCIGLYELSCSYNQLTTLDVSGQRGLEALYCNNNQLTTLKLNNTLGLYGLSCGNNQLTSLNVSWCEDLAGLSCSGNQLSSLDLSRNTALEGLDCANNQLTSLDLKKNTALTELRCGGNLMASLDLSRNTELDPGQCSFGVQRLPLQELAGTGGIYTCKLVGLLPDPRKVTVTTQGAAYDPATGVVTLTGALDSFTYQYATGQGPMDVTVPVGLKPPTIKTQPKSVTVKSGAKAKFTVKVKEKGVSYQWFERASETDAWTELPGEAGNTLTVVGTRANTGYQYRCLIRTTEGGEAYTAVATLTVTPQPATIKTQSKSAKVKSGAKVKLSVKATGPNLSYQWFARADADGEWAEIEGANAADHSFTANLAISGSQYYCRVWNDDGSADSNVATLTVTPVEMKITGQPKNVKVKSGAKAKFSVKAVGAGLTYQWLSRTDADGEWVEIDGATGADYSFTAKLADDGRQYTCRVRSADGEELESGVATLTVTPQPIVIKIQPKDVKAKLGAKAKFTVKATGPNLHYQWYRKTAPDGDWELIDGANAASYSVVASEDNNGWQFFCRVSNDDESADSAPATLTLK